MKLYYIDDDGNILEERDTTINAISNDIGSGQEFNMCVGGDSLVDGTNTSCELYKLLNEDGDFTDRKSVV